MSPEEILILSLLSSAIMMLFIIGIILFAMQYRKKKRIHEAEKRSLALQFELNINQAKLETQDETLAKIGRELHDNIGQLLTVSKIHSNSLVKHFPEEKKVIALDDALHQAITEVKALSKSLDNSRIHNFGLVHELLNEVQRVNKIKEGWVECQIDNNLQLEQDKQILIYRIIQEFMANSMKYSQCKKIRLALQTKQNHLDILLEDDGIGFDTSAHHIGSGMNNMIARAKAIQAERILFESKEQQGTRFSFSIPQNT